MKENNKRRLPKRFFIILILIISLLFIVKFLENNSTRILNLFNISSEFKVIKKDLNKNYPGTGQQKIKTVILQLLLQKISIKKLIKNINRMVTRHGATKNIGVVLWQKMVAV